MSETFDLGFLGLNGAIDAEVAQALLSGKNDITIIPASARYITDKKNGAALYNQARRIMKIAWDQEMRREGVKCFSGNYTKDHPPTLLKDTDAAVIAQFTTKKSAGFHGLGVKSIEKTATKYRGEFDWVYDGTEKQFVVNIAFFHQT